MSISIAAPGAGHVASERALGIVLGIITFAVLAAVAAAWAYGWVKYHDLNKKRGSF